jgi:Leucine rich repeat N-terminal domain
VAIKTELDDPYNVLGNWDINSVDPCSWRMVTCDANGFVLSLSVSVSHLFCCKVIFIGMKCLLLIVD